MKYGVAFIIGVGITASLSSNTVLANNVYNVSEGVLYSKSKFNAITDVQGFCASLNQKGMSALRLRKFGGSSSLEELGTVASYDSEKNTLYTYSFNKRRVKRATNIQEPVTIVCNYDENTVSMSENAKAFAHEVDADFVEYVKHKELLWTTRAKAEYQIGEKVCSYDNKLGYIENIAENNQKVLWKGRVLNKAKGYFFGKRDQFSYKEDKFEYDQLDDIRWETKEQIGKCDFELL